MGRTATIDSATTDSNLENEANLRGGGHNIGMEVVGGQHSESTGHFAPVSFCPFDAPEANDSCYLEGYDYLECYYPSMIAPVAKGILSLPVKNIFPTQIDQGTI